MHLRVLSAALLVVSCAARGVDAQRDTSCDDDSVVSPACGFELADPDGVLDAASYCEGTGILALQAGCFVCVDPESCMLQNEDEDQTPGDERDAADEPAPTTTTTPASSHYHTPCNAPPVKPTALVLVPIRDEHAAEKGIKVHPHQAIEEAAVAEAVARPRAALQQASNWHFLIPACLALVSVGIALRRRLEQPDIEFERVEAEDEEEINPFCSDPVCNPQQDDHDLEYGNSVDSDDASDTETHEQR